MNGFSLSVGAPGAPFHAAAHSHHPWPDVTLAAQEQAWRDAARLLDHKWTHIFGTIIPKAQSHITRMLGLPDPSSIVFGPNTHSFVVRLLSCLPQSRPIRVLTTGSEFMSFARQIVRLEEDGAMITRIACEPFESFEARFCEAARAGDFDLVYVSQVFFDFGICDPGFVGNRKCCVQSRSACRDRRLSRLHGNTDRTSLNRQSQLLSRRRL